MLPSPPLTIIMQNICDSELWNSNFPYNTRSSFWQKLKIYQKRKLKVGYRNFGDDWAGAKILLQMSPLYPGIRSPVKHWELRYHDWSYIPKQCCQSWDQISHAALYHKHFWLVSTPSQPFSYKFHKVFARTYSHTTRPICFLFLYWLDIQKCISVNLQDENIHGIKNLDIWLKLVKLTELNISEFWFLNFNYISDHWEISKNIIISGIQI